MSTHWNQLGSFLKIPVLKIHRDWKHTGDTWDWGKTGTDYKPALEAFRGERKVLHWIVVGTPPPYIFTKKIIELSMGEFYGM